MEEFFTKIINALPVILIALPAGWLGSWLQSYFSEKGKNLATKEDIQEITAKIEFVKNQFGKKHLRSKAYIERQIQAYDELGQLLHEISNLGYKIDQEIEFIQEGNSKLCKAKHESASDLLKKFEKNKIFLSPFVSLAITNVCEELLNLSETEYLASITTDPEKKMEVIEGWNRLGCLIDGALLQIRRELIDE
jgi:hypothetical protein